MGSHLAALTLDTGSMEHIANFEEMLWSVEERMLLLVEKPSTRVQACQLLAKSKGLRLEVEEFSLPDLEAEYTEEEGERLDAALEKYNDIRQSLAETQAKAETLCVCWDKLDADVTELTEALTSGGGSKITMDRLEQSINTLKSLFIERQTTIQELTPTASEKEI